MLSICLITFVIARALAHENQEIIISICQIYFLFHSAPHTDGISIARYSGKNEAMSGTLVRNVEELKEKFMLAGGLE